MTNQRRPAPSPDPRSALIEAALSLLATDGPAALTTRRVAAEAGTTTMTLYSRFGDKQGIEHAVAREGFTRLSSAMADAAHGRRKPLEALVRAAQAYRRFARENPALYRVMFQRAFTDAEPDARTHEAAAQAFATVAGCVERHAAIEPLSEDSETIALRVWAMCHGACSLELDRIGAFADADEAFFSESIRSVVRGHEQG
jgi:AcrR family transcriptional regulator